MNKRVKNVIIVVSSIVGVVVIGYIGFVVYVVISITSGCGMDDGPFEAVKIDPIEVSDNMERFQLSKNGELIIDNRNETLSPILILIENGEIKWTLDSDVGNTKGYETCRISKIENVTIQKDTDPIIYLFSQVTGLTELKEEV